MWPFITAAGAILAVAGGLALWHWRSWKSVAATKMEDRESEFLFIRFRRRMQIAAMLALAAVLIGAGPWIVAPLVPPIGVLVYWLVVVVLLVWVILLAGADMLATRMHYARAEAEINVRTIQLRQELDRVRKKKKRRGSRIED